jgi:drug/metabolite transporter (DMT)-like permease
MNRTAILYALASAALFGLATPAAKVLLGSIDPGVLAGLFYCGAGLGVAVLRRLRMAGLTTSGAKEIALTRRDAPWLAGAVICGGIAGPLLLMIGLTLTTAATASLLLTFEAAATALIAWFIFHEHVNARVALGMALLVAGAAILAWSDTPTFDGVLGPLAIVGACIAWGLDNNLTRKVSLSDPLQIVEIKGLIAGPVNLLLAFWTGAALPAVTPSLLAMAVGFVGYGLSLVLFVLALRDLGSARTGAYFSTAPFVGSLLAVAVLAEPVTLGLMAAGGLMALGVWLHLTERHEHRHVHEPMAHSHPHVHDEHHRHAHAGGEPPGEPHSHFHQHGRLDHSHPHSPDMHHGHKH